MVDVSDDMVTDGNHDECFIDNVDECSGPVLPSLIDSLVKLLVHARRDVVDSCVTLLSIE